MSNDKQLKAWWAARSHSEALQVVPKASEYGSRSLVDLGRVMGQLARREYNDEEATEAAIFFYVQGKMARWTASMERGERVSDDTLEDIGVYVKMVQRLRDVGGWPHGPGDLESPKTEEDSENAQY